MTDREAFEQWFMTGTYGQRPYDRFDENEVSEDAVFEVWQAALAYAREQASQPQGPVTTGGSIYILKRILKELPDLSVLDLHLVEMARSILEAHENRPRINKAELQKLIREGRAFADNGEDIERRYCEDGQASQGQWIPVSDRLPEQRKSVLICIPNREEPVIGHLHSTRDKLFKKGAAFVNVTHWMPLPAAPLPQGKEGE
jgi:hypothetical protein